MAPAVCSSHSVHPCRLRAEAEELEVLAREIEAKKKADEEARQRRLQEVCLSLHVRAIP